MLRVLKTQQQTLCVVSTQTLCLPSKTMIYLWSHVFLLLLEGKEVLPDNEDQTADPPCRFYSNTMSPNSNISTINANSVYSAHRRTSGTRRPAQTWCWAGSRATSPLSSTAPTPPCHLSPSPDCVSAMEECSIDLFCNKGDATSQFLGGASRAC